MNTDERLPDEATPEVLAEKAQKAEDEGSPPSEEEVSESKKRRERRKAHIAELKRQKDDAEAKLERITKAGQGEEPREEDYDDPLEYAAAKAVHMSHVKDAERERSVVQAEVQDLDARAQTEINQTFAAAVDDARARYQNYDAVALNVNLPVTEAMAGVIQAVDNGPDVLYHLGSNPAEAARISTLTPQEQAFELGRMSAALTAPQPKTVTEAPPPIKPVTGRSPAQRDPSKMSMDEYKKWRGLA